jgi:hypothetical protein
MNKTNFLGQEVSPMKVRLVVILLFIAVVTFAVLVMFFREATQGTMAFEIAKSLLQLGVVAVVGAIVTLAMTDYQLEQNRMEKDRDRDHQRYEYREDLLTSTLSRTVSAYSRAKMARRLFRARAGAVVGGPSLVRLDDYDRFMEIVNDVQLQLEALKGDLKSSKPAFSNADSLFSHYKSMESYLGHVVKEYEGARHRFPELTSTVPIADLKDLSDFLGPTTETCKFKKQVVNPYHEIQKAIRADCLYPKLPHAVDT